MRNITPLLEKWCRSYASFKGAAGNARYALEKALCANLLCTYVFSYESAAGCSITLSFEWYGNKKNPLPDMELVLGIIKSHIAAEFEKVAPSWVKIYDTTVEPKVSKTALKIDVKLDLSDAD